jgi:hypothetical protein
MGPARIVVSVLALVCAVQGHAQQRVPSPEALFEPLDTSESIAVSIVDVTPEREAGGDAELAVWALRDWARALDGALRFHVVDDEDDALVRIRFVPPGGGQYGEMMQLSVNGKRGAAVFVRPDTQALGPVIARRAAGDALFRDAIVYLTCVHELGHALGLAHTAEYADIMYAFGFGGDIEEYFMRYRRRIQQRPEIQAQSALSESDRARVRAIYKIGARE